MGWQGNWVLFVDRWFMTLTMCFGSFIAGATSEGGGAVAFPVMTLGFGIHPAVARDFSLMIQAVGMTSASLFIFAFGIPVERRAIVISGIGGAIGIILGLEFVAPIVSPAYAKTFFTSLWLSFAVALYWVNRDQHRATNEGIPNVAGRERLFLFAIGLLGGCVSSVTGSGLDILTFTMLTLLFRVNEKVATPTSVVLMASNALVGAIWQGAIRQEISAEAIEYWWVCVPVVVVGAPLGAYFIRQRTREFIAKLLYVSIAAQFIGALLIIPLTPGLIVASTLTLVAGICLFAIMASRGRRCETAR